VISEPLRKEIMRQALRGVEFLHSHGVVHRDIKLENLFVSSFMPLEVKVGDYDRACILPSQCNTGRGRNQRMTVNTGNTLHMSPERVYELEYTANCDSFSLGMCEFIMCGGFGIGFDWEKLNDRKILREKHNEIASGLHSLDGRVSPDCISFMLDAMRERNYPAQLMTHRWLQQ